MRIVFVLHAPRDPRTAVFAHAAERAAYLESRGHRVEIWTHDDEPGLQRIEPRWWPFAFPLRIARRLAAAPADLAIFHSFSGWAFHLFRPFRPGLRRTRSIVQFHGVETLHYRAMRAEEKRRGRDFPLKHRLLQTMVMPILLRLSCRGAAGVFCLNRSEKEFLAGRGWARRERIEIVPNAAPEALLDLPPRDGRSARRLLFLGQWLEGKGIRDLIPAFVALATERQEWTLACVGTRASAETVRTDFPAAVRERVLVVPDADRAEIASAFGQADLFVFPSLSEGSSLALLEAMAAGLPIVTTSVGSVPDLLRDEESALLVPVESPDSIAAAIRRLERDPALRARIGAGARKVAETLPWSRLGPEYGRLIERIGGEAR